MSLQMLLWCVTENATLMWHWKGYNDGWRVTEKATPTCHWKDTMMGDESLKRLLRRGTKKSTLTIWRITENAMMTVAYVFTELQMKLQLTAGAYKSTSWGKKYTHT
jgi:hypothetical protein